MLFYKEFLFEVTFLSQKKVTKKWASLYFRSGLAPSTFFLTKKKADIKELEVKEREYLNPSP